jgi:small GTP-binding protein
LACFKDEHGKGKSIEGSKSVINKCRRRLKNHRLVLITSIAAIVTDLINQVLKIMPHEDGVLSLLISLIKTRYPSNFMNTKDQIKTLTISYPTCKITSEPGTNTSKLSLLILGIEDSGKSTLLATLGGSKDPNCKPTLGFRPMSLRYSDKVTIKLNDLGGQKRIRGVWENYYHDSHGIIFVLDSSCSKEKFEETISVAKSALGHRFLQGKPLLVICNKKDRPETKSVEAVKEHIKCITQSDSQILVIKTSIHPKLSCTNNGRDKTINNAIEWIIECVLQQAQEIEERINRDKEEVDMFRRKRQVSSTVTKWKTPYYTTNN